jgi:hypothetical protein
VEGAFGDADGGKNQIVVTRNQKMMCIYYRSITHQQRSGNVKKDKGIGWWGFFVV